MKANITKTAVAAALVIGATSAVGCAAGERSPAAGGVPERDRLVADAHSEREGVRQVAVGRLLPTLKPGMTQAQTEAILGKPASLVRNSDGTQTATYYTRPTETGPVSIMSAEFEMTDGESRFTRVGGPHRPRGG